MRADQQAYAAQFAVGEQYMTGYFVVWGVDLDAAQRNAEALVASVNSQAEPKKLLHLNGTPVLLSGLTG